MKDIKYIDSGFLQITGDKYLTYLTPVNPCIIESSKAAHYQSVLSFIDYILSTNRDNLYLRGMGIDMYI